MAAFGLFLLLSAAVVASGQLQQVAQESLDLRPPSVKQVLQQEQDLGVPPDILMGVRGAMASPRSPPAWGSALEGFPPAWPVAAAVTRHCRDPPTLPPPLLLPSNAFSHLRRQAAALDALRPRLNDCCRHHAPLPCARRAWTDVLDGFCTDEFGVKTRQFHCCRHHGAARRRCFAQETPAPTWDPVPAWDPTVAWNLVTEPPFPPGEPTAANLGNICGLRALRPGAPGPGARSGPRVRLRVRLEREYGRCCRNESLSCAHSAVSRDRGDTAGREGLGRPRSQVSKNWAGGRDPGKGPRCLGWHSRIRGGDPCVWERPGHPGRGPRCPGNDPCARSVTQTLRGWEGTQVSGKLTNVSGRDPGIWEGTEVSQWLKGLNRFCREESAVKTGQHRCCQRGGGRARAHCFAAAAPHPEYDRELHNVSLARPSAGLLLSLCGPTRLFTQRRPVPELLGAMTAACCPLPHQERSACAQEQLSQGIATLCATPRDAWLDPQDCCSWEEPERRRCFDNTYLSQVTLGAAVAPPAPGHEE